MTKRTNQPKKLPRLRKLGFMARNSSASGRRILKRRMAKGRAQLTISDLNTVDKNKKFSRRKR